MYSVDFDTNHEDNGYRNSVGNYKPNDHPDFIEFTVDEVAQAGHDAGTAGTHWYLSIDKNLGNNRTRRYYGVGIHVEQWFNLFKREMDRARQGLEPTRYMAVRARENYWVEPKLCNPAIDSSQYTASQKVNQKKMVA